MIKFEPDTGSTAGAVEQVNSSHTGHFVLLMDYLTNKRTLCPNNVNSSD